MVPSKKGSDFPKYYELRGYKLKINTQAEPVRWEYCSKYLYITLTCEDDVCYTAEWSYAYVNKSLDETNRTEEYVRAKTANKALKLLGKRIDSNYRQYAKHYFGK